jgi:hypothetical protein
LGPWTANTSAPAAVVRCRACRTPSSWR